MKKVLAFLFACLLLVLCAGCGGEGGKDASAVVTEASASVDLDLTGLSSTMVYSEVANIVANPTDYVGKTIRAKGQFKQNKGYYFIVINDATACCAQGLEFIWAGQHSFPEDYPQVDTEIIVTGTFEKYMEGEKEYYHINDATLQTA